MQSFFKSFNNHFITISVQPESGREKAFVPEGKWFNKINRVRAIPFDTYFTEEVQLELQQCQSQGCAVYFLINEGNDTPTDAKLKILNCGKRTNIIKLKTLVIDTDDANPNDLVKKLKEMNFLPHYVVESSPQKYHFYFLIEPEEVTLDTENQWKAVQKFLQELIPDLDKSMADINQVLRVPSFYNLKPALEKPFQVSIKNTLDIPKYKLSELYKLYVPQNPYTNGYAEHTVKDYYNRFDFPLNKLTAGERRTTICRYIEHIMENILPLTAKDEDYFVLVDAFILKYLKPEDQPLFLEGGKRRQNLIQYLHDQKNYRLKKLYNKENYLKAQQLDNVDNVAKKALPNQFYLNFPGDLGMIVNEIHSYSPNLSLELAFAAALMISGALKSETFRFKGAWPFVNGLVIATTGGGKSTIKGIVEKVCKVAGLMGKYPQVFGFQNSVQSLHTSLYSAGGSGTVIVDESGDYLETITAKNAPGYAKALKKYFKESTTGKDKGTWLHAGGSLSFQVPPIDGGMLSLWMLIQPDKFEGSLSLEDMSDGFLPRFFIFNGRTTMALTKHINEEAGTKTFEPSTDLQVLIEAYAKLIPCLSIDNIVKEAETEIKQQDPKSKKEDVAIFKRDAVYQARSEARKMSNIEIQITKDAHELLNTYLKHREEEALTYLAQNGETGPAIGVYIRMEEMMMRLLCNAASYDFNTNSITIDERLADACIQFHRFQTDRFLTNEVAEMGKGEGEKDLEAVMKGFKKAFKSAGNIPVKTSDIIHCIRSNKRPKNITFLLNELVKRGELLVDFKPHSRLPNHKITCYIPGE